MKARSNRIKIKKGFSLDKVEKIEQFKKACLKYNINMYMMASIDRRWITIV